MKTPDAGANLSLLIALEVVLNILENQLYFLYNYNISFT